jgi:hypothetical protein
MKNIILALTGLVLLSSCVFAPGKKDCDCGHKHEAKREARHERPHFKRPAGFQGPKSVSEMKQGD